MTIQKIKSGRVITVVAEEFVGDKGVIFYNEGIGDLRLGDGVTPGGQLLSLGGTSTYVLPTATTSTLGGIKVGANLSIDANGVLNATGSGSVADAFKTFKVPSQSDLIASGADTLEFIAGPGMTIRTNTVSSTKQMIFESTVQGLNIDGGYPDSIYGGIESINGGGV